MAELQQRTEAWHIARQGKLTASNLGAALGLNQCISRQVAFRRACGLDKFEGNEATTWGNNNEQNGVLDYSIATGNMVDATGLHVHPHHTWLAGSPDGLVATDGLIEVKCPFYFKKNRGRLHRQVPMHYYLQMNACMACTERNWCDYVCWTPEGMAIYRVVNDHLLFDYLTTHSFMLLCRLRPQVHHHSRIRQRLWSVCKPRWSSALTTPSIVVWQTQDVRYPVYLISM
jgi:putative phage-type endonuclease